MHITELCCRCFGVKYKPSQIAANENRTIWADFCCILKVSKAGIWRRAHQHKFRRRHLPPMSGAASAAELCSRTWQCRASSLVFHHLSSCWQATQERIWAYIKNIWSNGQSSRKYLELSTLCHTHSMWVDCGWLISPGAAAVNPPPRSQPGYIMWSHLSIVC